MKKIETISDYLIEKLIDANVKHVFGVPGDYALQFYHKIECSDIKIINTTDALGAGYAVDAYARVNGLGALCLTYGVGGLCVINAIAQAFSEKVPIIVISGIPSEEDRNDNKMHHHKIGSDFNTQLKIFQEITVASTRIENIETAVEEIDRVFDAAKNYKQPVYIELPSDIVNAKYIPSNSKRNSQLISDPIKLEEVIQVAVKMINNSKKPVILAGFELQRFGLQEKLLQLLNETSIPFATMILDKSIISEHHPNYMGLYIGEYGKSDVRDYIESSDCIILLGALQSELNLGVWTAKLNTKNLIDVQFDKTCIQDNSYENIYLSDVINGIVDRNINKSLFEGVPHIEPPTEFIPKDEAITIDRTLECLNLFVDKDNVIIADPGNTLFVGADITIHKCSQFFAPAYYLSLGYAVPAGIGIQLARPSLRPIVLVGDGGFLMNGMELATAARFGLSPIIIVFNNMGYTSERSIVDGKYNDIPLLDYSLLPSVFRRGKGFTIKTELHLVEALNVARKYTKDFCILDIHLDKTDIAPILKRVASALRPEEEY